MTEPRAPFGGSLPALVTPMREGAVDWDALGRLVEWQVAEGSSGLVPVGTTGESPTLTHEEHEGVVTAVVEAVAGRVPVIAGAGSNNTAEAIRLARHAESAGADGILVVTPYYNKPTQDGLVDHFEAVANACGLPMIIYNIPPRSVIDMSPSTMGRLAKHPNIVGVKDATADVARVSRQRIHCGPGFVQLSGEDASALGFNAHGGVGCISVTANVAPRLCADFQRAMAEGRWDDALALHDRLMPLHDAIFTDPGVAGAKYGLSRLGRCENEVRLPLRPAGGAARNAMDAAMEGLGLL